MIAEWWRLRAGFNELQVLINQKPGSTDLSSGSVEAADSKHYFYLRTLLYIAEDFGFSANFRYVSKVAHREIPEYSELDLMVSWQATTQLELSLMGKNLLHKYHAEFGPQNIYQKIERSVFGKVCLSL